MTTEAEGLALVARIQAGDYDHSLTDITNAVDKRTRKLEPWGGVTPIVHLRESLQQVLETGNTQQRAQAGTEIIHHLKRITADYADNEMVQELARMLTFDVFVHLMGVPRDTAQQVVDKAHAFDPDPNGISCKECGLPEANRRHLTSVPTTVGSQSADGGKLADQPVASQGDSESLS